MKKLIYKQGGLQNIQNYKTICYISITSMNYRLKQVPLYWHKNSS
jgi:hypothetical protein